MQNSTFGTNQFSIRHSKFRIQVDARLAYLYQIHRPNFKKNLLTALFTAECAENAEIFNFDFSSAVSAFSAVGSTVAERYTRLFCLTWQYQVCRHRLYRPPQIAFPHRNHRRFCAE